MAAENTHGGEPHFMHYVEMQFDSKTNSLHNRRHTSDGDCNSWHIVANFQAVVAAENGNVENKNSKCRRTSSPHQMMRELCLRLLDCPAPHIRPHKTATAMSELSAGTANLWDIVALSFSICSSDTSDY